MLAPIGKSQNVTFYRFLTPAATSDDVERLFSECANVLDSKRIRTKPERVDQEMFLKKNMFLLGFSLVLSPSSVLTAQVQLMDVA